MFSPIKAPAIRDIPPIDYLPTGEKQEGGLLIKLLDSISIFSILWGMPLQALLRYGFGSRYFTLGRITISAIALLLLILARNLYLTTAATWEGWAIEGNIINYAIGVVLVLNLIMGLRAMFFLFLFWLGYMILIAGANPLSLLIEAVDGFYSFPTLAGVTVLVGAMLLHRSLAHHWEKTTPEDKHIHSYYYGRSVFWRLYPNDTVNTLVLEPLLLLGVYFMVKTAAPELAFYVLVLGVSTFLLSLKAWHVTRRYHQNRTDGKRYSTDQLDGTEKNSPTPQAPRDALPMAGVIKKKG